MSSIPRDALNTRASNPGVIGVPSSALRALARATTSCGSEMSAGVIRSVTSAAAYPSIRSAPTLKIWITPRSSVAMLEKFALLKIAFCSAPALSSSCSPRLRAVTSSIASTTSPPCRPAPSLRPLSRITRRPIVGNACASSKPSKAEPVPTTPPSSVRRSAASHWPFPNSYTSRPTVSPAVTPNAW